MWAKADVGDGDSTFNLQLHDWALAMNSRMPHRRPYQAPTADHTDHCLPASVASKKRDCATGGTYGHWRYLWEGAGHLETLHQAPPEWQR